MKKFLALLLALCMVFALCACGSTTPPAESNDPSEGDEPQVVTDPNAIEDSMNSDDGTYEIAFVTDIGSLKDKSFNEGTWNGVKLYAYNNGLSYKYYQPANENEATDDDRFDAMSSAANAGAKVVVCAGFLQEGALARAAAAYPDTMFVFIDGGAVSDADGNVLPNVAGITFMEEQCGYLAGYAVVTDGYTKLGFTGGGGGTNPAVNRYGYGFAQGAAAAAEALNTPVELNYSFQYGASYSASPELQTMCTGWYNNGTEVIFACGGSMFQSVAAAASASDALVVGVDTDQAGDSDTVLTSAMKGIGEAAQYAIGKFYDGSWADIGGVTTNLGAADNAVGLPTNEESWRLTTFTVEQYEALMAQIIDGTLAVDGEYPEDVSVLNNDFITITIS